MAGPAIVGGYGLGGLGGYGGYGAVGYGGLGRVAVAAPAVAVAQPALGLAAYGGYSGLGLGLGLGGLRGGVVGAHSQHVGPVSAAIETRRYVQVVDVPTSQDVISPSTLIVEPNVLPVNIEFRSQSSPVNVNQVHIPGRPGTVQQTSSEEEPDRLVHEVVKPVIQEVRETIVPFRRITQEVLPVQEEVNSLVARGQRQQVLAAPQVVAAPQLVAQPVGRVAVAGPVGVANLGLAGLGGLGVAGLGVARPAGLAVVGGPALATGGLVTTGINRFGGVIGGGYGGFGGIVGGLPVRALRS